MIDVRFCEAHKQWMEDCIPCLRAALTKETEARRSAGAAHESVLKANGELKKRVEKAEAGEAVARERLVCEQVDRIAFNDLRRDYAEMEKVKDRAYLVAQDADGRQKVAISKAKDALEKLVPLVARAEEAEKSLAVEKDRASRLLDAKNQWADSACRLEAQVAAKTQELEAYKKAGPGDEETKTAFHWADTSFVPDNPDLTLAAFKVFARALRSAWKELEAERERADRADAMVFDARRDYENEKMRAEAAESRALVLEAENKAMKEVVKALAGCDPVYGPIRVQEKRKNPLDFDEKPVYTSRRFCGLCRRSSAHQGENVTHTMECPWFPVKAALSKLTGSAGGEKP